MAAQSPIHHSWSWAQRTQKCKQYLSILTDFFIFCFLLADIKLGFFLPETKVTGGCELFPLKNTPIFLSSIRTLWHITAKYKLRCHVPILQLGSFKSPVCLSQWIEVCADLQERLPGIASLLNTTFAASFQLTAPDFSDISLSHKRELRLWHSPMKMSYPGPAASENAHLLFKVRLAVLLLQLKTHQ